MTLGNVNKKIDIRFDESGIIYTARAGLVPIMKIIRETKIDQAVNAACTGMWGEARSPDFGFENTVSLLLGVMAGFPRAYQITQSSEANFFAQLLNVSNIPSQPALSRFISSFEEKNITAMKEVVNNVGTRLTDSSSAAISGE